MGPLAWLCCLAVVVSSTVARPSAEVSGRDARGQTISDSSDPFWVFRSSGKPTLYGPNLQADDDPLIPAQGTLISMLPSSTPRRRRPILAILDLLQKRYSLQQTQDAAGTVEGGSDDSESKNTTDSTDTTEGMEAVTEKNIKANKPKPGVNLEQDLMPSDISPSQHQTKVPQISKIYALLDSLMKDHPDPSDGFSYAFKYRVPQAPTKMDDVEVSVQQSISRYPQLSDDALQNRNYKTKFDYAQVQSKLDSILEDSANKGTPIHLNTPGAFGPLLLNQYLEKHHEDEAKVPASVTESSGQVQESRRQKPTKLILRPVAKAVAGPRGIAVASPLAKAVLRRGQKVTLEYEPDAVAIAGPGGRAHAHPQFSIDYIESKEEE